MLLFVQELLAASFNFAATGWPRTKFSLHSVETTVRRALLKLNGDANCE